MAASSASTRCMAVKSAPACASSSRRAPSLTSPSPLGRRTAMIFPRPRRTTALRVAELPRSEASRSSTIDPFGGDCPERDSVAAFQAVAMDYFAEVGNPDPKLTHIMEEGCIMTDRVMDWCFRGRAAVEGHFKDFASKYCSHEFCHLDVFTNLKERTVCAHWALTVIPRQAEEVEPCLLGKTGQISGVHIFRLNADNKIAGITTYRTLCASDELFDY